MNSWGIVRTKPEHYNDCKSPAQLAQRQRMQVVSRFLLPYRELIRVSFAAGAIGRSALKAAQSVNMHNALAGEYPDSYVDKKKVLLSRGPLSLPVNVTEEAHAERLYIRWQNGAEAAGKAANDTLVVVMYNKNAPEARYRITSVKRSEGHFLWKLPGTVQQETMPNVWSAF